VQINNQERETVGLHASQEKEKERREISNPRKREMVSDLKYTNEDRPLFFCVSNGGPSNSMEPRQNSGY
jgi:hypothetical protein